VVRTEKEIIFQKYTKLHFIPILNKNILINSQVNYAAADHFKTKLFVKTGCWIQNIPFLFGILFYGKYRVQSVFTYFDDLNNYLCLKNK